MEKRKGRKERRGEGCMMLATTRERERERNQKKGKGANEYKET